MSSVSVTLAECCVEGSEAMFFKRIFLEREHPARNVYEKFKNAYCQNRCKNVYLRTTNDYQHRRSLLNSLNLYDNCAYRNANIEAIAIGNV